MAWAFLTSVATGSTANEVTTTSIDTTGAKLIIIGMSRDESTQPINLSDNKGNEYSHIQSVTQGTTRCSLFYCINPSVGAGHTFSNVATSNFSSLFVAAFSGEVASSNYLIDKISKNNISSTTLAPGSVTPSEANELVITHLAVSGAASPMSIDGGFTETNELDFSSGNYYGGAMAYLIQTTATAANPTWTRTNSNPMSTVMATFRLAQSVKTAWLRA